MAHKKAAGSTSYGRDSQGQRLGIKLYSGEFAQAGSIITRQRGTKIRPGINVAIGSDDTLFAKFPGFVKYRTLKRKRFDGSVRKTIYADIVTKKTGE